jgi:hypothetical protein
MKTQIVTWVFATVCLARVGAASDVGFQLETEKLQTFKESTNSESPNVELLDRVWAAPGVEQAYSTLPPARKFGVQSKRRLRIEGMPGDAPEWMDDIAWPRTRELFRGEYPVCFGGIVLAR